MIAIDFYLLFLYYQNFPQLLVNSIQYNQNYKGHVPVITNGIYLLFREITSSSEI